MPTPFPTDLAGRRLALGLTREQMAAGIGLRPRAVEKIERWKASEDQLQLYATWLKRIEGWTMAERQERFQRTLKGERFE